MIFMKIYFRSLAQKVQHCFPAFVAVGVAEGRKRKESGARHSGNILKHRNLQ